METTRTKPVSIAKLCEYFEAPQFSLCSVARYVILSTRVICRIYTCQIQTCVQKKNVGHF
jgi:hypothetical protein